MSTSSQNSAQPQLRAGDRLREYRIVGLVGTGGMGAVYEAVHEIAGARVAIKEILIAPGALDGDQYRRLEEAFLKESTLLLRLDHNGIPPGAALIPRAHNVFQEGSRWYLVMEFIAGDTLAELVERADGAPLRLEAVRGWLVQLLATLDYLHRQEPPLVHRDIKPSNLKINEAGDLVLLDFGIALGGLPAGSVPLRSQTVQFYTPHYSPPEQMRGKGVDGRGDLFSAAATVYYLLTGIEPPPVESRGFALLEGDPDPLTPLHQVNRAIPQHFSKVIQSALEIQIEARPASAATMHTMLTGKPPTSRPRGTGSKPVPGAASEPPHRSSDPGARVEEPVPHYMPEDKVEAGRPYGQREGSRHAPDWGRPSDAALVPPAAARPVPWTWLVVGLVAAAVLGLITLQVFRPVLDGTASTTDGGNPVAVADAATRTLADAGGVVPVVNSATPTTTVLPTPGPEAPATESPALPTSGRTRATSTRLTMPSPTVVASNTPLPVPTQAVVVTQRPAQPTSVTTTTALPPPTTVPPPTAPPAPVGTAQLVAPGAGYNCYNNEGGCLFQWDYSGTLAPNQYFQVQMFFSGEGAGRGIHAPSKGYELRTGIGVYEIFRDRCDPTQFCNLEWAVAIVEWDGVNPGSIGRVLSLSVKRPITL